jgi:hypothetical protein
MAICKSCRSVCRIVSVDFGAGPYEFGSERSAHSDVRRVTSCCRSDGYWMNADEFASALAATLESGGIHADRLAAIWLLLPEKRRP